MDIFREKDGIAAIGHGQHDLMHIAALLVEEHIVAVEVVFQNFAVFAVGVEADQLMAVDHVLHIDVLTICTPSKLDRRYKKICCAPEYLHIHEELREMDWEIFKELCKGIPQEQVELFLALSEKMLSNIESL